MIYAIDPGPLMCGVATWTRNMERVHDQMPISVVLGTLSASTARLVVCEDIEYRGTRMGASTIGTAKTIGMLMYASKRAGHRFKLVRKGTAYNWLVGQLPVATFAGCRDTDARVAAGVRAMLAERCPAKASSHAFSAMLLALYAKSEVEK